MCFVMRFVADMGHSTNLVNFCPQAIICVKIIKQSALYF